MVDETLRDLALLPYGNSITAHGMEPIDCIQGSQVWYLFKHSCTGRYWQYRYKVRANRTEIMRKIDDAHHRMSTKDYLHDLVLNFTANPLHTVEARKMEGEMD